MKIIIHSLDLNKGTRMYIKFTWNIRKNCYEASLYYLREAYEIDFHTNDMDSRVINEKGILYESDLPILHRKSM